MAASVLAPHAVHVRSHLDAPVADILIQALSLSKDGDEAWRERIATAEKLAPGFFEVPRVHAFIESSAGRIDNATRLYERALSLVEEPDARAIVAHFFAGHLTRTAMQPATALPFAEEAATERVKGDETTSYADWMSASRLGSLIHATLGSFGGVGGRCRNRAGFAW